MRLYVGGRCQGKLDYVLAGLRCACGEQGDGSVWRDGVTEPVIADGETCPLDAPLSADILNHFHLLIKRLAACDRDIPGYTEEILIRNPQITVICDEVGMGIVPADAFERRYREAVGRCCCMLGRKAECVERIVCGRSMRIK